MLSSGRTDGKGLGTWSDESIISVGGENAKSLIKEEGSSGLLKRKALSDANH
jgi:hypothetical protein